MGSKNRIFLGIILKNILHFHRNFFINKKIYMSKRTRNKIMEKHNNVFSFTECNNFSLLLNSVIASFYYDEDKLIINFIAYMECDERFILFSLKKESHHISCNTIFSLKTELLKKYSKKDNFKLFDKSYESFFKKNEN